MAARLKKKPRVKHEPRSAHGRTVNYDANDLQVPSLFYSQLLTWWSDFRFASG